MKRHRNSEAARRLRRFLISRGTMRDDADDLVQEAVLRLYLYARGGGTVHDQQAFLTRCALNLAVDSFRRSRVQLYEHESIDDLGLVDLAPAPDEVLAAEQRLNRLTQTLDRRASVRTREVFFMHRLLGYSHAEIATMIGVSKSAVEKHIASAVTLLCTERHRQ